MDRRTVKNSHFVHAPGAGTLFAAGLLAFHLEGVGQEGLATHTIITGTSENDADEINGRGWCTVR